MLEMVFPSLENEIWNDSISDKFKKRANIKSPAIYAEASQNREDFWAKQAACLDWFHPWNQVLKWTPPYAEWFIGGKLNACYNCLDRHMKTSVRKKIAILWEGEKGRQRAVTYEELYKEVNKFSNVLKNFGIRKGDKVAIYLPMVPEAIIAMLSCARIGAVHTVIFAGFSVDSLKDRIVDSGATLLITADGIFRKGKIVPLKATADAALKDSNLIKTIITLKYIECPITMQTQRDYWYDELMKDSIAECPPEIMDAEDELFILYTSGTTGKPKGIIHTTGGYMVGVTMTTRWVFDVKSEDIYWCTADIGWVTGHSYVVYGPLSNGMTQVIYDGAPDFPSRDRFWKLIEKYKVTILYTAPTAIRMFMKWGEEWPKGCDLSSLRLLGSVGESINPEAWLWYYNHIGRGNCPIVDTWWQTETGSIMVAPLPGLISLKPGSATKPLPGVDVAIIHDDNDSPSAGYLVITSPWPSMLRGIHNDPIRYKEAYWNKKSGCYFTGDGAKQDKDGYFWFHGRVDDIINVSGHRLGTMEIESALLDYHGVAEAGVVAVSHPIKGQAIIAFVILKENMSFYSDLENDLKQHIAKKIGAIARPERVFFTSNLPKTRSGKIIRRLLRDIAEGRALGDITTLSDVSVIEELMSKSIPKT